MSKKLLEEQSIRKFMKIAGLQPLANSFLKENETVEEAYGKKKMEEEAQEDDKKLEEVEDLEEGGGQMPFDAQDRREDERAPEGIDEAKAMVAKASKMKGAPASQKMKPLKEEEDAPEDMTDAEGDAEMETAPEAPAAGGLDVEGLVKELIRVITDKVPGAADVISVEEEGDELEVEANPDVGEEEVEMGDMEGEEDALDEAALEQVVAETVKRVKARLMESKKATKPTVSKQEIAKKVAEKVAEKLKKV